VTTNTWLLLSGAAVILRIVLTHADRVFDACWTTVAFLRNRYRSAEPLGHNSGKSVPDRTASDPQKFFAWVGLDEFAVYDTANDDDRPEMLRMEPTLHVVRPVADRRGLLLHRVFRSRRRVAGA
jgi:hypothetical protein